MKRKLIRFAEVATFKHVIQPKLGTMQSDSFELKGKWHNDFFKNQNPIILELACGKGEYTVNLAKLSPSNNYIGIDIKGARIWRGAKTVAEDQMQNVGFLRTRIENIGAGFAENEISEIWITFPDPQLKKPQKRLTYPDYLNIYKKFLKPNGIVHLKTDSQELHEDTLTILKFNKLEILEQTNNLYESNLVDDVLSIKTFYENQFLNKGKTITYLKFRLKSEEILNLE